MNALSAYYRQLGGMLEAGIPLLAALHTVSGQVQGSQFRRASQMIGQSIESGQSLHEAMRAHDQLFDESTIAMVRAGQTAGRLAETFKELAILEEKRAAIRSRVRRSLIYPCFLVSFALVVGSSCLLLIMPVFENIYAGEGEQLPKLTRMLIDTRIFLSAHWLTFVAGLVAIIAAMKLLRNSQTGRIVTDGLILHLPIAGSLSRKIATARFTRTLSHLVRTGVVSNSAIKFSAGAVRNRTLSICLAGAADAAARGETMSSALAPTKILPEHVINMLKSGEATARSDEMLEHVADLTEQEVEAALSALTALIAPLLIVIVGAIVGVLAIGILAPILTLSSVV